MGNESNTPASVKLFRIWKGMFNRCYNPNCNVYRHYGGKGIQVCERWSGSDGFKNFMEDMGPRPEGRTSVDRIDGTKDYSPENCRWATPSEQNRNKNNNVFFEYNGEKLVLADWSKRCGIKRVTLWKRINIMGWSLEKALTTPTNNKH